MVETLLGVLASGAAAHHEQIYRRIIFQTIAGVLEPAVEETQPQVVEILGQVARELRQKGYQKIISLAPDVL